MCPERTLHRVASPAELDRTKQINKIAWRTPRSALIDIKSVLARLANRRPCITPDLQARLNENRPAGQAGRRVVQEF